MNAKLLSTGSLAAAVAGAIAIAQFAAPAPASAADGVKCYGISKKGENDCGNKAGTHSCAGKASADYDGGEWKKVASKEACTEAGGQLEAFDGMNPKKKST